MISYLCLLDAIVDLHAMDEKIFDDFLIGKWKWIVHVINTYVIQGLDFVYTVDAFITLH